MPVDLRNSGLGAAEIRDALALAPHPEGGCYRELWRDQPADRGRGAATTIVFLLAAGERSHWHRVDAAEIWLWQAGAPLQLHIAAADRPEEKFRLGPDLGRHETLQMVVPHASWQAAESLGAWSLVACVVAPAFEFAGFELAPPGWQPPNRDAGP